MFAYPLETCIVPPSAFAFLVVLAVGFVILVVLVVLVLVFVQLSGEKIKAVRKKYDHQSTSSLFHPVLSGYPKSL